VTATSDVALERLLTYVDAELGFSTGAYNRDYLVRRVATRLRRTETDDYRAYHRFLQESPPERAALLDALSVNVTSFFRNPEVWESVRDALRDRTATTSGPIRVWSAACSEGREAYSVALLALTDPEIDDRRVEIVGTDIKESVLEVARGGVYRTADPEGLAEELAWLPAAGDYLDWTGDTMSLSPAVTRLVRFERRDLLTDRPFRDVDLLLCRNFLIYVDGSARDDLFATFADAVVPGGYLTLGMTETLPTSARDAFETVVGRRRVYRRTGRGDSV
jgi:chemotaxis protein methyltransferase CheR